MVTSTFRSRACGMVVLCAVFALAINSSARRCSAVSLPIGGAVAAAGEPEPDPLADPPIATTGPVIFGTATYSGTLTSSVYTNDSENPYGLDRLTFTYVIHNDFDSENELHRLTVSGYESFLTDVSYSSLGAGLPPFYIDRSIGSGDVVGLNFPTPIPIILLSPGAIGPGMTSAVLVVQTDAFFYQSAQAAVINGTVTQVESLGPIVPEPSALVLAAVGMALALMAAFRRRCRRT